VKGVDGDSEAVRIASGLARASASGSKREAEDQGVRVLNPTYEEVTGWNQMTDLSAQKRLAADVMDVGKTVCGSTGRTGRHRRSDHFVTRSANLVDEGRIQADEPSGNSRGRARERNAKRAYGHQNGQGEASRQEGRTPERERRMAEDPCTAPEATRLRDKGELTPTQYRTLYKKAGGGEFRSVQYLLNYIDETTVTNNGVTGPSTSADAGDAP